MISLTRAIINKACAAENESRSRSKAMTDLKMSPNDAQIKADTDALTGLSNRRAFERMLGAGGDRVLRFVSSVLLENCGKRGAVSRHGGEEFVVIFEETTPEMAYDIIDAARRDLCERNFINKDTNESIGTVSFSAGVAVLAPSGDVGYLLRNADRSLYRAKASGRNCVVMSAHS